MSKCVLSIGDPRKQMDLAQRKKTWRRVTVTRLMSCLHIDPLTHHTTPLQASKFDSVINKHRSWQIAAVFFYEASRSDSATTTAFKTFDSVAKDLKGMFRFAAVDCEKDGAFCRESNVVTTPSIMIYPRNPMPAFKLTKIDSASEITKTLTRQLPSEHIKQLNANSIDSFLSTGHLPKVVLFSSKSAAPPLFKALSNEFRNEMQFGVINYGENIDVANKFKIKKAGSLMMQEVRQGKPVNTLYKGELNYPDIQAWCNLRRETFVKGGGFAGEPAVSGASSKPWREEAVPELTRDSGNDVCFKQESLCLIYLKQGKIEEEEIKMLTEVKDKFPNELSAMKLGYIDIAVEEAFGKLFLGSPDGWRLPQAVLFNPHKRLRFSSLSGEGAIGNKEGLVGLLDKALSGDARYKVVKELPAFVKRKAKNDEL